MNIFVKYLIFILNCNPYLKRCRYSVTQTKPWAEKCVFFFCCCQYWVFLQSIVWVEAVRSCPTFKYQKPFYKQSKTVWHILEIYLWNGLKSLIERKKSYLKKSKKLESVEILWSPFTSNFFLFGNAANYYAFCCRCFPKLYSYIGEFLGVTRW